MNSEPYIARRKELIDLFRNGNKCSAVKKLIETRHEYPDLKNELVLVSILTPSRNSAKYIEETIVSVINQTYSFVEHIVQDGNSTDGTLDILEKYSKFLHYVSEPDRGEADGLNKAFKRASGDILLVLNADDVLLPESCLRAVKEFEKNRGAAVIYGNQHMINSSGEILYDRIASPYNFIEELCVENVIPAQTAFIQREFLEMAGYYVDASLPVIPDYELWIRIGLRFLILYVPQFICKYRVHEDQQTTQIKKIVETRLLIMDRLFNNPEYSEFHKYRQRAYAGNMHWAAIEYFKCRNRQEALPKLLKSYELNPDLRKANPLISVITVSDNSKRNLEKNIISVLEQAYLYVEHIIIDNNSTDGTLEIIKKYDRQVHWESVRKVNKPEALNLALKKCHGDIIHVLEPDNEMSENSCWWATYHFNMFPGNIIVFGDYILIDDTSKIKSKKFRNKPFRYKRMFCLEDEISLNTCFIKREKLDITGSLFDTTFSDSYFYEFLIRSAKQYGVSYHKGPVTCSRIGKTQEIELSAILKSYEEKRLIILKYYHDNKNPGLLKNRAIAGLNYWLSCELLNNGFGKKGLRKLFLSILNPFTFLFIIENFFMALFKIFKFIRHINYLVLLKPTYSFRRKFGLTSEQINSRLKKVYIRS